MNTLNLPRSLSQPSAASHLRALGVIALKDWRHFVRYPLEVVTSILQPLIWLTPVYFMGRVFSVGGQAQGLAAYSGTGDYMAFILIGQALINFINAVFWGMGYALKNDMDTGVLEANWLLPMPRVLLLAGRTLASLMITTLTTAAIFVLAALLFGFKPSGNAVAAVLTTLPMLLGLYGFGLAFAALVMLMKEANTLVDVSSFLVQLLSGSNFPVQALPRWLLPVALALPLTYGLDAVRYWLLATRPLLPVAVELGLLLVFMVGMLAGGYAAFKGLERRVRRRGGLQAH
ncbi:MAG: ABC transporter permease [Anaerolineales bacterium]|nr:ABC transporter permease [Anaerolineales bacterium]